jgi:quercetin dioxygenase-like cupin family protein
MRSEIPLRSEQSGGHVSVIVNAVGAGWEGPPLHHHAFDEAFYVLDGELTFQLDRELAAAGPGALVFAPRDSRHTLANLSGAPARYALICTPAGFERRFEPEPRGPVPEVFVVGPRIERPSTVPRRIAPGAARINVLLRSEQSGGHVAVMDNTVPAGITGPPLHHHAFDETFYVLEGELTFQLDGERLTRRAGELAFAPRDVPHTFTNLSGEPARMLLVCTPAGFERHFDRMAARAAGVDPPPEAAGPIPEVVVVGPPIGEPR